MILLMVDDQDLIWLIPSIIEYLLSIVFLFVFVPVDLQPCWLMVWSLTWFLLHSLAQTFSESKHKYQLRPVRRFILLKKLERLQNAAKMIFSRHLWRRFLNAVKIEKWTKVFRFYCNVEVKQEMCYFRSLIDISLFPITECCSSGPIFTFSHCECDETSSCNRKHNVWM